MAYQYHKNIIYLHVYIYLKNKHMLTYVMFYVEGLLYYFLCVLLL